MIDYLVTWLLVSSLPIVSTPSYIFTRITAPENRNGTDNSVIKHLTEHFENSTVIRLSKLVSRDDERTTEHAYQPMCAYIEKDSGAEGGGGRERERADEGSSGTKREGR